MLRHELSVLGHVARTHGVNGAVLIRTSSDIQLNTDEPVFVDLQGPVPFFVESMKCGSGGLVVKFEWIDTIEAAEKLVGSHVLVEADSEIEADDYPIIGFKLIDLNSGRSGEVVDVKPLDHHPILIVDLDGVESMIPFVEEYLDEVDEHARVIKLNLPEGLLDL